MLNLSTGSNLNAKIPANNLDINGLASYLIRDKLLDKEVAAAAFIAASQENVSLLVI